MGGRKAAARGELFDCHGISTQRTRSINSMNGNEKSEPKAKQPRSIRKKLGIFALTFLLLMIFVFVVAGTIATMSKSPNTGSNQSTITSEPQSRIGQAVSDSGFSFVVNSIKCGETHLSTGGVINSYSDAQGQYCRLNITVTNTGNSANSIDASDQYVFNSQGQRYDYASGATATADGNYYGTQLNSDINPGNSVTGDVVFDVPVGTTPTSAELHGKSSSKGVKVNL